MADVLDVAEQILITKGPTDTYSLQKLVYYSHAYHLAKYQRPLFSDEIQAWANGPAVPTLFQTHRGNFRVSSVGGDPSNLAASESESISMALRFYGDHDSTWLVSQTHTEAPWIDARQGLDPGARGSSPISDEAISKYFDQIFNDPEIDEALADAESDPGVTVGQLYARYKQ
jgi:uncharacterized phage-associated protein